MIIKIEEEEINKIKMVQDQLIKDKNLLKEKNNQKFKSQLKNYKRIKPIEFKLKRNKLFLIYQLKEVKAEEMLNQAIIEIKKMIILKFQIFRFRIKDPAHLLEIKIDNSCQVIPLIGHKYRQLSKNQIKKLKFQKKKN